MLRNVGIRSHFRGLELVAASAGWMPPHARVCWLSDRPVEPSFDRWGWPHSSSRPAVRYPDGWSIHAWKGARVPAWVINAPQDITLDGIDTQIDPLVRNAGCYGSSLGRKWSYRGAVIDSWAVVEFPACGEVRSFRCILPHLRTLAER